MGARFSYRFGGIWLSLGLLFIALGLYLTLVPDPSGKGAGDPYWIFAAMGAVFAIPGAAILARALRADLHDRRLLRSGLKHPGAVTRIEPSPQLRNRERGWFVHYTYEFQGRTLTGRSLPLFGVGADGLKPGDPVQLVLDPDNPEDSLLLYS